MARTRDEIRAREPLTWGVVHTAIWIATRQLELVEMVLSGESIDDASSALRNVIGERRDLWPDKDPPLLTPAVQDLWRRCVAENITMYGRPENKGASSPIPATAWAGLEIQDGGREGVIAAPHDRHRPGVAWWGGLTLKCEDVQLLWPLEHAEVPVQDRKPEPVLPTRDSGPPPGDDAPTAELVDYDPSAEVMNRHNETSERQRVPRPAVGSLPTYSPEPTYSPGNAPDEFKSWADEQHSEGIVITVAAAEDAMRGPQDENGNRFGGRLRQGVGLSRDTIREWVKTLPDGWYALRGETPSRKRKRLPQ